MYQALNSGRADAAATDMSSTKWFVAQNPDQYIGGGYGWDAQTYSCAAVAVSKYSQAHPFLKRPRAAAPLK